MLEYFTACANKHKLLPHISFSTEVVRASEVSGGADEAKWEITTRTRDGSEKTQTFDFLVVASGMFERPFMPTFENAEKFQGRILHSSGLVDPEIIKNKRVLVVGNGKSSADMVAMCGEFAKDCLMIFRRAHWIVPRYIGGKISTRFIFYGRWYRYIFPFHNLGHTETFIQTTLNFLVKGFWAVVTHGNIQDMKVAKDCPLIPDIPTYMDASLSIAPPGYYEAIHAGKARYAKTEIARFVPDSKMVELTNGKSEEFDVVICATGYKQEFPFFDDETITKLQIPHYSQSGRVMDSPFRLYRSVVPLKGPSNIGFVGFQNSICNGTVYEAQANWLGEYFLKNLKLPSEAVRTDDVDRYLAYEKKTYPRTGGLGCYNFLSYIHLVETLLNDINVSTTRTGNFFKEYIMPVYPQRYQIREEKVRQRTSRTPQPLPATPRYLSFSRFVLILVLLVFVWRYLL
eukprot:Phypoly_transcript_08643.p1 GENE.Phypoly_transcript_08643~~Phypoly_transcript_08643.p1  ORF type:complete len:457 (+),score=58.28 Phypoly_transcript_08643:93-1463(+)